MEGWKKILTDILTRLTNLENNVSVKKITIPTDGYFVVKEVTIDPSTPKEGEMWVNTTTSTFKIRINGVTKTITLT